jgi:hypothetical protein
MIDMIRDSSVPPNLLRAAAKGALSVPPGEMVEILVFLTKNVVLGEQARITLAGWDEISSRAVAADPHAPAEVLAYMVDPRNRRPGLFPVLLENPSVAEPTLIGIATGANRETLTTMLASPRVNHSKAILGALRSNQHLTDSERANIDEVLGHLRAEPASEADTAATEEKTAFEIEHAAEIAAEEGKPYQLIGGEDELLPGKDFDAIPAAPSVRSAASPTSGHVASAPAATAVAVQSAQTQPAEKKKHVSVLQKIAKLTVGERVQLAMKGNKDERFLLIRDGAKIVAQAVLESPKLTDTEAEMFAAMKNVQEVVLRGLAAKRKFAKNYRVLRNLAFNPKCPMDLSLTLLNHLLLGDLKALSTNKEIGETVRKMGLRLFLQKSDTRKGGS